MEVMIEHLGALQFEIKTRGHSIVSDQPRESGGFDEGMTPPELLLASLGSCAAYYAADYLRRHKLAAEGTRVRIVAEKEKNPARVDNFRIEIDVPVGLSEAHQQGVEDAVHRCLIHNTLLHPPKIEFLVRSAGVAAREIEVG
jgi:putative redox protein